MLDKDEEQKLDMYSAIILRSKEGLVFPRLTAYDIEWLANKLKEINTECSAITEELYSANQALANLNEWP